MIYIIYLAAGQARRFGSNKLLAMHQEKPLYRWGLDAILASAGTRTDVTVTVVSCWAEIERELMHEWNLENTFELHKSFVAISENCQQKMYELHEPIKQYKSLSGLRSVVHCPDSHLGVSHSIHAGIASLPVLRDEDYLCFAVADQPNLRAESITKLLKTADGQTRTACLSAGGNSGNPVLFHNSLVPELMALQGDRGGKAVMRVHPEWHVEVPCDPSELWDIDVPDCKQ